jgi:hypothetical protein
MNEQLFRRIRIHYVVVSIALFYILAANLSPSTLIMTLNALFIGTMASITVSYGGVLVPAIFGRKPYDDVRQMAIGILFVWTAYSLSVLSSVYIHASDIPREAFLATAAGRWLAINGAIIQITAPDFGNALWYGRDRKLLWAGLGIGAMFAVATYWLQEAQALGALAWAEFMGFS